MPKLQSSDCKELIKKESRTTARYHREQGYKIGQQVGISRSTYRRNLFIQKYGSEEIKECVRCGEISIYKAYLFVRYQQRKKALGIV